MVTAAFNVTDTTNAADSLTIHEVDSDEEIQITIEEDHRTASATVRVSDLIDALKRAGVSIHAVSAWAGVS